MALNCRRLGGFVSVILFFGSAGFVLLVSFVYVGLSFRNLYQIRKTKALVEETGVSHQ